MCLEFWWLFSEGVIQDYKKAFEWYSKSAEQGNVDAQFTVGMMYHRGDGTAQNNEMAEIWLKKAADNGHKDAISLFEEDQ